MNMHFKPYVSFITIFLVNISFLAAQGYFPQPTIRNIAPCTPEASSFLKYSTYPVSYDKGLVDINISIFNIETAELSLPISLSYHHKGLRESDYSEYLGLGWLLIAEPKIVRKVNGAPDPISQDERYKDHPDYLYHMSIGLADEFPDDFVYSLAQKRGAFIYKDKTPITLPYEPIKINKSLKSDDWFEIIDDDGTYYRFGKSIITGKSTASFPNLSIGDYIDSWKVTEIISPTKEDTIKFEYEKVRLAGKSLYTGLP